MLRQKLFHTIVQGFILVFNSNIIYFQILNPLSKASTGLTRWRCGTTWCPTWFNLVCKNAKRTNCLIPDILPLHRQKMNTILTKLTRNSRREIKHHTLDPMAAAAAELVDQTVNPHLQWAGKELLRFVFKRQLQIIVFIRKKIDCRRFLQGLLRVCSRPSL